MFERNTAEIRLIVCKASEFIHDNYFTGIQQSITMLENFIKQHLSVLFDIYTKEDKQQETFDVALRALGFSSSVFSPYYQGTLTNKCTKLDYDQAPKQSKQQICSRMVKITNIDDFMVETIDDMMLLYYKIEHLACNRSGSLLKCYDLIE